MVGAVSKDIVDQTVKRVKEEMPLRKGLFGPGDEESAKTERKEQATDLQNQIKALRDKDFAAAKAISDKYATKALTEGTNADGGYTVPTVLLNDILRIKPNVGIFRKNATILPVDVNKLTIPSVGSVVATRTGEGVKKTATQPTFGVVNISIKKIAAIVPLTDELINDSPSTLMTLMGTLAAEATSKLEDQWGFLGLGAGEGLFQNTSVPVLTLATGKDTYVEMDLDDALAAMALVNEDVLDGAKWYMSFSVLISLWGKKDSQGRYLITPATDGKPATFWGFPIELVGSMPKTSDGSQPGKKFLAFGNLKHAILADRQRFTIDVSNEATITDVDGTTPINLWQQDMTAIRVVERIDIQIAQPTAFVVVKTAAT